MSHLTDLFLKLPKDFGLERSEAEYRFIEELTFSCVDDILLFLEEMTSRDFLILPVWLRNLAYRLATLQRPADAGLLRKAAADLECFGPTWDDIAASLRTHAEVIDKNT